MSKFYDKIYLLSDQYTNCDCNSETQLHVLAENKAITLKQICRANDDNMFTYQMVETL